jgi:hypothetical protein
VAIYLVSKILCMIPFFIYFQCYGQPVNNNNDSADNKNTTNNLSQPDTIMKHVKVSTYVHYISDINFKDQEYKIELWLAFTANDPIWLWDSLE